MVWTADDQSISEAQQALDGFYRDDAVNAIDKQIEEWEKQKELWSSIVSNYEKEQDHLIAVEMFGDDYIEKILNMQSEGLIELTDTQYKSTQAMIEQKNKEIEANNEVIKAWNEYKEQYSSIVDNIQKDADRLTSIEQTGYDFTKDILEMRQTDLSDMINSQIRYTDSQIEQMNKEIEANNEKLDSWNEYRDIYANIISDIEAESNRLGAIEQVGYDFTKEIIDLRKTDLVDMLSAQIKHTDGQIEQKDKELKANEEKIKDWQNLKTEWEAVATNYELQQTKIDVALILGASFEEQVLDGRLKYLRETFVPQYNAEMAKLNTEVASMIEAPASIDTGTIKVAEDYYTGKPAVITETIQSASSGAVLKRLDSIASLKERFPNIEAFNSLGKSIIKNPPTNFIQSAYDNIVKNQSFLNDIINNNNKAVTNNVDVGGIHVHETDNPNKFAKDVAKNLDGFISQELSRD